MTEQKLLSPSEALGLVERTGIALQRLPDSSRYTAVNEVVELYVAALRLEKLKFTLQVPV